MDSYCAPCRAKRITPAIKAAKNARRRAQLARAWRVDPEYRQYHRMRALESYHRRKQ